MTILGCLYKNQPELHRALKWDNNNKKQAIMKENSLHHFKKTTSGIFVSFTTERRPRQSPDCETRTVPGSTCLHWGRGQVKQSHLKLQLLSIVRLSIPFGCKVALWLAETLLADPGKSWRSGSGANAKHSFGLSGWATQHWSACLNCDYNKCCICIVLYVSFFLVHLKSLSDELGLI